MLPQFNNFTTKAKESIRRAHELAIERGQNQVNSAHFLASILLQEESLVISALERLDIDTLALTDHVLDAIEEPEQRTTISPSFQIYLTPDFVQVIEHSAKIAAAQKENLVSIEHIFLAFLEVACEAREILLKFKIEKESVMKILEEFKKQSGGESGAPKKMKSIAKFTRNLTAYAREDKLDPVIGRDSEIMRIMQILSRRTKR